jgi:hypothetical protein
MRVALTRWKSLLRIQCRPMTYETSQWAASGRAGPAYGVLGKLQTGGGLMASQGWDPANDGGGERRILDVE